MIVVFIVTFELCNFFIRSIGNPANNAGGFIFADLLSTFSGLFLDGAELDPLKALEYLLGVSLLFTSSSKSKVDYSTNHQNYCQVEHEVEIAEDEDGKHEET